jgi:hypothetical protein
LRIPSIHLFLGLPAGLFQNGFQLVSFLTILSSSILCMCPNHLSLCALIQRTIFTPPVKVSNSQFVLILQLSRSLTGP